MLDNTVQVCVTANGGNGLSSLIHNIYYWSNNIEEATSNHSNLHILDLDSVVLEDFQLREKV